MMGDAIAHSVLPGIVVAFLVTSSRDVGAVFIGAAIAAMLSAVTMEMVRRLGRVESGAAMGVVFSIFFAAGVLLLEQAAARSVDLDADCLLHGQLETIFWFPPVFDQNFFTFETLMMVPQEVGSSFAVMIVSFVFVLLLYKELKITAFDSALAASIGYRPTLMYYALMIVVAAAVVASFKAVGSILVISMLICGPAAARMCTDRLIIQLVLSVLFTILMVCLGYVLGAFMPQWLGYQSSVNIAGSIAVVGGLLVILMVLTAPRYGVIAKYIRDFKFSIRVVSEDVLAWIYRRSERNEQTPLTLKEIRSGFKDDFIFSLALRDLIGRNLIQIPSDKTMRSGGSITLSDQGNQEAKKLLQAHRLWENYLVAEGSFPVDHVHNSAETIEHFTESDLIRKLEQESGFPTKDPHGKDIPR